VVKNIVAGALYDFLGYLSTRDAEIKMGADHDSYRVLDLLEEWAELRGLDLSNAEVLNWQEEIR
jgi:hypothetical protein